MITTQCKPPRTEAIVSRAGVELAQRVAAGQGARRALDVAGSFFFRNSAAETLKRLTGLTFISEGFNDPGVRPAETAVEFWKEYDAKKAAPK